MPSSQPYFWKQMPFVRLILPLMAGIIVQFYLSISTVAILVAAAIFLVILLAASKLPIAIRYNYRWLPGIVINLLVALLGMLMVYNKDIRHKSDWVGNYSTDSIGVLVTIQEPLVEKERSYKADAQVEAVNETGEWKEVEGRILVYFSKDSTIPTIQYGSQVVFYKSLQEIKNSGNPGAFDYKQYNAYHDIFHQVFLKSNEYIVTNTTKISAFSSWLFRVRSYVIETLQEYIHGPREAGVAEALLIGYRNDLDKDLVQAYSNTGVVHIIAISGLHLGMIYAGLVLLLRPLKKCRWNRIVKPLIILTVLWVFSLLAGGVPSILRSAVMFSFIVLGEAIDKKSSIYNTLAASAFVMLCYNPYFLWDIGFQLSYIAVISIVAFSRPVYNWFYVSNKILDFFWKLCSVTIAAQILTMPIIFYSFHQFPNLFLITNCFIVPLSSIILFAELAVVLFSFVPVAANFCGIITSAMLRLMNGFIEYFSGFHYAVYDSIQNSFAQTILLYIAIIACCIWLMKKLKRALFVALIAMLLFVVIDGVDNYTARQQEKVIVYNVPKQTAIDFIAGYHYSFVGDSAMTANGYLQNFHLKPSRTLHRITFKNDLEDLYVSTPFILFKGKRIVVVDKPYKFDNPAKIPVDLIIISKSPRLYISELYNVFDCKQYIFDGSNSLWKINKWKKDCDSLHLRYHVTADHGAYVLEL